MEEKLREIIFKNRAMFPGGGKLQTDSQGNIIVMSGRGGATDDANNSAGNNVQI